MRCRSPSPDATRAIGRALARSVGAEGLCLVLAGPLGAGKTVFVKGLAEGLGLDPVRVTSPTFVIASEYPVADAAPVRALAHVDCYRLGSAAELEAAGFADLLAPGALVAVEWGDRFPEALPDDRLEVRLGAGAPGSAERLLQGTARGPTAAAVSKRWIEALAASPETAGLVVERAQWP